MNREIKFRAWDGIRKEMIYNSNQSCFDPRMNVGWELMQFTGLKDKNGRDMFEGDLCASVEGGIIGKIEFHNGAFCWTDGVCYWPLAVNQRGQVIDYKIDADGDLELRGNIFENSDLLGEGDE